MSEVSPSAAAGERPRLAYLFSRYPVVSHTFVDNEILGLEAAGWDVVIGSFNPPLDEFRHERLEGLKAPVIYPAPPEILRALERRAKETGVWPDALVVDHEAVFGGEVNVAMRCRNALSCAERLKAYGVDHVHIHFANRAAHSAVFVKALSGIPFSFTPQGQDFLIDVSPALLAELCREAKFVIAPCEHARKRLIERCPNSADKFTVNYNGIDPSGYPSAKPAPSEARLRIASVGRLIEFKGFHHLIAAIDLAKEEGVFVELELLGDGPWRERLEKQTKDLGLDDRIRFGGTVGLDEMKETFAKVDAFVLASITDEKGAADMFPTVNTEAMLCGLPIISSRLVGIPEQVIDGETGFLVDPGDEPGLAAALVKMAREDGLAARMGAAGHEHALQHFDRAVTLPKIGAEFQKTPRAQTKPAPPPVIAFYDWSQPGRIEQFRNERTMLEEQGAAFWIAAGTAHKSDIAPLAAAGELQGLDWLPDGMALEMEWRSRPAKRAQLTAMRSEFEDAADSEDYFVAARRALWITNTLQRRGGTKLIYAAGPQELLTASLVHRLSGIPVTENTSKIG